MLYLVNIIISFAKFKALGCKLLAHRSFKWKLIGEGILCKDFLQKRSEYRDICQVFGRKHCAKGQVNSIPIVRPMR